MQLTRVRNFAILWRVFNARAFGKPGNNEGGAAEYKAVLPPQLLQKIRPICRTRHLDNDSPFPKVRRTVCGSSIAEQPWAWVAEPPSVLPP